jgi:hypothetical protein
MECSICLSDITAATGVYTTSCGHSFHFRCAVTWFVNAEVENCPMCRHEMGENEKLPEEPEEEEDEEEEGEDESFVRSEIPRFDDEAHALWVFRKTFQMLDDNLSIVPTGEVEPIPESDLEDIYWRANRTACRQIDDDDGYETA